MVLAASSKLENLPRPCCHTPAPDALVNVLRPAPPDCRAPGMVRDDAPHGPRIGVTGSAAAFLSHDRFAGPPDFSSWLWLSRPFRPTRGVRRLWAVSRQALPVTSLLGQSLRPLFPIGL